MTTPHYDVVIAGAGPAGCAAAIRLRQFDISVCLIDDVQDKIWKIGESLPGAAIRLLDRLGIQNLDQLLTPREYVACVANVAAWGTNDWTYNDAIRNPQSGGWHILRHRFDTALRQLALQKGVAFYTAKIGKITRNNAVETTTKTTYTIAFKTNKKQVPRTIISQWLIDATGRSGAVLKQLNIKRWQFEEQFSAFAWLKPDSTKNLTQTTRIKSVEHGWWYSTKLPDNTRIIAFYGLSNRVSDMVKSSEFFIAEANRSTLLEDPIAQEAILEGVAACNASTSLAQEVTGASWLAIGDAAFSLDPISSQGIFFALYSGIKGAETIATTLGKNSNTAQTLALYREQIKNVFLANQNSRTHFYTSELRYTTQVYWKQYHQRSKII